eukprot:372349-Rhodomonas_salina.1
MIHEKEPLVNTYVSVPKDFGHLNCASFVAGAPPFLNMRVDMLMKLVTDDYAVVDDDDDAVVVGD